MPRVTLAALMLALGSLTLLIEGGPRTTAEPFVRVNGPPAFTTRRPSLGDWRCAALRAASDQGSGHHKVLEAAERLTPGVVCSIG